ncbi:MAG: anthranilate synthase component II [Ruminiclostridium sp.]
MILMLDNYDSFVYNLVQLMGSFNETVKVYRNDEISVRDIRRMSPQGIVLSPGPCSPSEAGVSNEIIAEFAPSIPILGVCLGHQCIGAVFGAKIKRAIVPKHGKLSQIRHVNKYLFEGIKDPLTVVRYHSLIIEADTLPSCLVPTAFSETNEIMGVKHVNYDVEGIQFHPESVFTMQGRELVGNFISRIRMKECCR